jgi:hypothetical protein
LSRHRLFHSTHLAAPEQPTITPTSQLMITIDAVVTVLATAAAELARIRAGEL